MVMVMMMMSGQNSSVIQFISGVFGRIVSYRIVDKQVTAASIWVHLSGTVCDVILNAIDETEGEGNSFHTL